jgi:hypothetical protein
VHAATGWVGSGVVRMGQWADWQPVHSRIGHWLATAGRASFAPMALITPHRRAPRLGTLVGGSVYGALLTAAGLGMGYLVLATPLTSIVAANRLSSAGRLPIEMAIVLLALLAGGALMLAGTNRLALTLTRLKSSDGRGPGARALLSMTDEATVVADVMPSEGRPIPELAIGPFGAVVIHVLPSSRQVRQVGASWERRTAEGWLPTENPLDLANRDAERVRRWFTIADLDFVVRVYAVVLADAAIARSATCAVLTPDQLPAWVASLPHQRSLTAARRARLLTLASGPSRPGRDSAAGEW